MDLLRDVIEARCARHPLIGRPHKVRLCVCVWGGCNKASETWLALNGRLRLHRLADDCGLG